MWSNEEIMFSHRNARRSLPSDPVGVGVEESDDNLQMMGKKKTISDFLVNEYPFVTEEFGKLQLGEKILKAFLFNGHNSTYIFTIEEGKIVSIYMIKSFIQQSKNERNVQFSKNNQKISNFRMAKRASLEVEYFPKSIEYFGDYFLLLYKQSP